ncbi:hypothetical protein MYX04_08190 [Nitrospiraceae bacterium AH_259_D15_M11_P09]|nr:hypothetical protein [Nitrospiraceae bacterium AH_259_D15_M11_P09]
MKTSAALSAWRVARPLDRVWWVNQPETDTKRAFMRCSGQRGWPFGGKTSVERLNLSGN